MSKQKCPWQINFAQTLVRFYDVHAANIWNPEGNPWARDEEHSVRIRWDGGLRGIWEICSMAMLFINLYFMIS